MGPPQGRAEGQENLPRPAAHTPPHAPQDPIGLLGTQGTLLARGHLKGHDCISWVHVGCFQLAKSLAKMQKVAEG